MIRDTRWSRAVRQQWNRVRRSTSSISHLLSHATTPLLLSLTLACGFAHAVDLRVATFKLDVTPPPGSPRCDGLVPPAAGGNDPRWARGRGLEADDQKSCS